MSEEREAFAKWWASQAPSSFDYTSALAGFLAARQSAGSTGQDPIGTLSIHRFRKIDSMVNHDFEYYGSLPDGTYRVYAAPIGDNGAKVAELEKENFALAAGQCVHKGGVMMDEYGHTLCPLTKTDDAQPAESKRVELSVGDLQAIESLLIGSGYVGTMSRVRALLAAKGDGHGD